ncbi:hydrogenase maturation peptidase HycI [Providencia alcalifaciens]|uniref:Hydrogenase maturation peptidase HycI n=2 Tax=Morganellaceae TaxID=1903414 RepID=B6XDS3_9GAMM|nr:hydrogenase maturation peptidase HycI [Providencia alcalifaciens]EEB46384.1 hydrogenase maturation peptidase HycI [Providencia alcalifaciens DSM 30120]MTC52962.1 hydrogenase maturation peptidase HycI [Providencia alcalifaciens]SQI41996.1 Hydrogenase 3 maturation protease [Providencia alcalifaciens]
MSESSIETGKVIFWSLRQKFVDSDDDIPEDAQQVMYYSLAIGHHVGMIDCLKTELECPLDGYQAWVNALPEGEARRKLQGLITFGEINIDSTHTNMLALALDDFAKDSDSPYQAWSATLIQLLGEIEQEPAIYLIVKRQPMSDVARQTQPSFSMETESSTENLLLSENPSPVQNLMLAVGNSMMGDDGAGPMLFDLMQQTPIDGWVAINGGSSPESVSHQVRALKPQRLLIVDAADIGLAPGEIRVIDPDDIAEMFIMSTHNLPLNFLIDQLKADVGEIIFLGIQPDLVGFYMPMNDKVIAAVEQVYQALPTWEGLGGFRLFEGE